MLPQELGISCKTGEGMDSLVAAILKKVKGHADSEAIPEAGVINARHQDCLARSFNALNAALHLLDEGEPPELLAVELRSALGAVGEIVGDVGTEEILGKIFCTFCIGK